MVRNQQREDKMKTLNYKIKGWDDEKNEWFIQSQGNLSHRGIMKEWDFWINRFPKAKYHLVIIVSQEILLQTTEND